MGCCDRGVTITLDLGALTAEIAKLKETVMAGQADLLAKITEVQGVLVDLVGNVERLIRDGDTTAALTALDGVKSGLTSLDAEVLAADPAPAAEPVAEEPAPVDEPAPGE